MFRTTSRNNNFVQKVFCMNIEPPVEVSDLDHALRDLSVNQPESGIKGNSQFSLIVCCLFHSPRFE